MDSGIERKPANAANQAIALRRGWKLNPSPSSIQGADPE